MKSICLKINNSIFLLIIVLSSTAHAERLPVESFANLPDVRTVEMSPDGTHLASLVRLTTEDQTGAMLITVDLSTGEQSLLLFTDNKKFLVSGIQWANNNKLLVSTRFPDHRGGTPTIERRLLIVDIQQRMSELRFLHGI